MARSTPHAHALRNCILDFNLSICIDAPEAEMAYRYVSSNGLSSIIDHVIETAALGQRVLECSIIGNFLLSDHVPLKIRLDLNVDHRFESITAMRRITRARYHTAVRHIMRKGYISSTTKMAEVISENRTHNLLSEVRLITSRNKL